MRERKIYPTGKTVLVALDTIPGSITKGNLYEGQFREGPPHLPDWGPWRFRIKVAKNRYETFNPGDFRFPTPREYCQWALDNGEILSFDLGKPHGK